jgi:hypothetical protein
MKKMIKILPAIFLVVFANCIFAQIQTGLQNGYSLSLMPKTCITINGDLKNDGIINIGSSAVGDASFILTGNIIGSGQFNVNRHLKSPGSYVGGGRWHLVSPPISNATAGVFMDLYLLVHNESVFGWEQDIVDPATPLTVGQGYFLWTPVEDTRTFPGTVNQGNVTRPLVRSEGANTGFNLIGNPYPSAIDWEAASGWTKNNVDNAIYFWNNNQYASYINGTGVNEGSPYIAMGQGFFVKVNDGQTTGSITMNNNARLHNPVEFRNNEDNPDVIRIIVEGNNSIDESVIYYQALAENNFDGRYDAVKLWGSEQAPQLYTKKDDISMAINSVNNIDNIEGMYVYLQLGEETEYNISFSHTLVEYNNLILKDLVTGVFIYSEQNYSFFANPDDNPERFQFTYDITDIRDVQQTNINSWAYNNILYVKIPEFQNLHNIVIYNMLGSVVMNSKSSETDLSNLSAGVYLIKVQTDTQTAIDKVVVK